MTSYLVSPAALDPSKDQLQQLWQRLESDSQPYQGLDRRSEPRYLVAAPAKVRCLNDQLQESGPAVDMVVRDLSRSGMGMLSADPVSAKFLAVQFSEAGESELLVEVLRCQSVGAYFDIGGRFVTSAT